MNNYELTTDDFNTTRHRYRKRFTWKAFKRFGWVKGQILCEKYDIILTGHRTKRELARDIAVNLPSYIDRGSKMIDKGFTEFGKMMNELDKGLKDNLGENKKGLNITGTKSPNFKQINNKLFGKKRGIYSSKKPKVF